MKNFIIGSVLIVLGTSTTALARKAFPRDLVCTSQAGTVTLQSNDEFWSYNPNEKFAVKLVLDNGSGPVEVSNITWANDEGQKTRGNDSGNRRYIFTTEDGKDIFVELEFKISHGMAAGVKIFQVASSSVEFQHPSAVTPSKCNVVFHNPIEL